MNTISTAALVLAAAFVATPVFPAAGPTDPANAAMSASMTESSVESLTASALKAAVQGRVIALSLDGKSCSYRVAHSRFGGDKGEVTLALVADPSKKAALPAKKFAAYSPSGVAGMLLPGASYSIGLACI